MTDSPRCAAKFRESERLRRMGQVAKAHQLRAEAVALQVEARLIAAWFDNATSLLRAGRIDDGERLWSETVKLAKAADLTVREHPPVTVLRFKAAD